MLKLITEQEIKRSFSSQYTALESDAFHEAISFPREYYLKRIKEDLFLQMVLLVIYHARYHRGHKGAAYQCCWDQYSPSVIAELSGLFEKIIWLHKLGDSPDYLLFYGISEYTVKLLKMLDDNNQLNPLFRNLYWNPIYHDCDQNKTKDQFYQLVFPEIPQSSFHTEESKVIDMLFQSPAFAKGGKLIVTPMTLKEIDESSLVRKLYTRVDELYLSVIITETDTNAWHNKVLTWH